MQNEDADRRRVDRRSADRRAAAGRRREDSAWGNSAPRNRGAPPDSFFDPGWLATGEWPADGPEGRRRAPRIGRSQDSALTRIYRTYAAARAAIGVGLVAVLGLGSLFGSHSAEWLALVSLLYAVQAITLWLLPRFQALAPPQIQPRQRRRQWLATIGVDLLAFTLLHLFDVADVYNYAALLVLPVLMAGVLTSRLLALGTAAGVALILLAVGWRTALGNPEAPALMMQSGLAGLGMFVIVLLAGELAGRLASEELAARDSLEVARQQAQLNRLVIEEMADGVLVVDRSLRVRAANPAARALLVDQGLGPPAPFTLSSRAAWAPLQQAGERALAEGHWPDGGRDVSLAMAEGQARTLRLRVRFMRARALDARAAARGAPGAQDEDRASQPFAVLLLEDLRTLQARIRQEKLAAMGRVSAGIAHEIRNPLAAIAQANALLLEDRLSPEQQRLAQMVADNVLRLKRLVDDVMEVAPGAEPGAAPIDATAAIADAAADWARTAQIPLETDSRLRAQLPSVPIGVCFDPEHLRRVLVNLLDNAQRHASQAPGAIFLHLAMRDEQWATLSVFSDGAAIAPEVERHLFEPFFSTRSRGTGLGLYICRELCARYGASIEYRSRRGAERLHNEFIVRMRQAPLHDLANPLPLHVE